jgi:Flp pilus assembly protein TadD
MQHIHHVQCTLDTAPALCAAGTTAFRGGQFHEAVTFYTKALAVTGSSVAERCKELCFRAAAFTELRQHKSAALDYEAALSLQPTHPGLPTLLAGAKKSAADPTPASRCSLGS